MLEKEEELVDSLLSVPNDTHPDVVSIYHMYVCMETCTRNYWQLIRSAVLEVYVLGVLFQHDASWLHFTFQLVEPVHHVGPSRLWLW